MNKKAWCTCKVVVLQIKPIVFLTFSLPSASLDLKVPYWVKLLTLTVDITGSLSNDDSDVNENGNNAIGLDWQNNNSARASRSFVHFFAVVARLEHESA